VATLRGGSFTGRGGTNAQGIFNDGDGTTLEAQDVTALGENGSTNNHGLYNGSGAAVAILRGGSFTGRGGTDAGGIFNSFTLEAERVTVLGENGSHSSLGLHNTGTASVAQSVLEGSTNSVYCGGTSSATVTVSNSRLVGGWVYGTVTCVAVSQDFSFYQSGCP
jgi:hypothetical protein